VSPKHQSCGNAASICDPAGGTQERCRTSGRNQVGNLRHERKRRPALPVTARFGSLSDNDVGPAGERMVRVAPRLYLAHKEATGMLYRTGEGFRVAE
jgi:hypothetical protein